MRRKNFFGGFDTFDWESFLNDSTFVVTNPKNQTNYEINYVNDGAYLIFEVPGFNKSNISIELDGNELSIQGKRTYKVNGEEREKTISQKYTLNGNNYNVNSIEATVEDGILTVFIQGYKKENKKKINIL
jgi:HSP20 family protein